MNGQSLHLAKATYFRTLVTQIGETATAMLQVSEHGGPWEDVRPLEVLTADGRVSVVLARRTAEELAAKYAQFSQAFRRVE